MERRASGVDWGDVFGSFVQVLLTSGCSASDLLQSLPRNQLDTPKLVRDQAHLMRELKEGRSPQGMQSTLRWAAYVGLFPDFGWPSASPELPFIRDAMLTDPSRDLLAAHFAKVLEHIREAGSAGDTPRQVSLIYCGCIGQFRLLTTETDKLKQLKELDKLCKTSADLLERIERLGLDPSLPLRLLSRTNDPAYRWSLNRLRAEVGFKDDQTELIEICRDGYRANVEAFRRLPSFVDAYRDAIEYAAMLVALGCDYLKHLDSALEALVRRCVDRPAHWVVLLLGRLEPCALDVLKQRPLYQSLVSIVRPDTTGNITPHLLTSPKEVSQ